MSRTIERERQNSTNSILGTSPVDPSSLMNRSRHGSATVHDRRGSNVTDNSYDLDSVDESPFGSLKATKTKWTFANLIAILNTTFPDHDFSNLQPTTDNFHKISHEDLIHRFNNLMISLGKQKEGLDWIWDRIDSHMHLIPKNPISPTLIPVQISPANHSDKQNIKNDSPKMENLIINNDKKSRSNSFNNRKFSNSDSSYMNSPVINPNQLQNYCQIFEFKPSDQSIIEDLNYPYQTMWSYYWFIYNKKKKKVAFIYLTAINKLHYSLVNGNRKASFKSSRDRSTIIGDDDDDEFDDISMEYDEEALIDDDDDEDDNVIDDVDNDVIEI